jgi:predicted HicB family RNase H-like nuclease|tara:strand:+ start:354 stop:506 length:153 start_codon:yes stop_codon:yes gene_type:complete
MKAFVIRLDDKVYSKLKKESKKKRVSMNRLVQHYCELSIGDDSKFKRLFG